MLHPLALVSFVGLMATPIQVPVAQEAPITERTHLITAVQMMAANRMCDELLYSPLDWNYFLKLDAATEGIPVELSQLTAKMAMLIVLEQTAPVDYAAACTVLKWELSK